MTDTKDSIQEEIKEYKNYLENENSSDQTIYKYSNRIKNFLEKNDRNEISIEDLKNSAEKEQDEVIMEIEKFASSSQSDSYAMKSYLNYIQSEKTTSRQTRILINSILEVADLSPETSGRSKKNSEKIKSKIYPKDEISTLIEEAPSYGGLDEDELRLYLRTMYYTAGRNDDIVRLEWRDVLREKWQNPDTGKRHDLEDEPKFTIHCNRSKSKSTGIVNVPEEVWNNLIELKEQREEEDKFDEEDYVFFPDVDRVGRKMHQKINYIFRQSKKKDLGYRDGGPSPHCFRHSRLTHMGMTMLDEGDSYEDIRTELARYGRHEDTETTDIYISKVKEESGKDFSQYTSLEV